MEHLQQSPWAYELYQLIRIIETDALRAGHVVENSEKLDKETYHPIGEGGSPAQEPLRFSIHPAMVFEPATVKSLKKAVVNHDVSPRDQWQVAVNVMGLIGATGVLPFRYSELIIQRLRSKDPSMKAFLDIFNHRTVSLLYRAWKKYRPVYGFETDSLLKGTEQSRIRSVNAFSQMLSGLCGQSLQEEEFNQVNGDWLNYAGVAAHRSCNLYTLKNVIHKHFGIKVKIHQFKGQWQQLDADVVTRLAGSMQLGMNNQLGQNAILGKRCWVAQNLFEIEVVDLDESQFRTLSPGTGKLKALYDFVKMRTGVEMDFDLSLKIQEKDLPVAKLYTQEQNTNKQEDQKPASMLGWNTRLHRPTPSDRLVRISISKYGMQYQR